MNEDSFFSYQKITVPRLVVAGVKGGSGKTIFTLGLARHLSNLGRRLSVFKKGPDYIDAKWLSVAARVPCSNLDPYFMKEGEIRSLFAYRSFGSEAAVIEGNRGLYDGVDREGSCSTAQLAKMLKAPVLLVIDCTKMTRSAAAVALGFRLLDKGVNLAGVVLNTVAGKRHKTILIQSIEQYAGIPVVASIPRLKEDPLPMRHLGLTPSEEHEETSEKLNELAKLGEANCDLDGLLKLMESAPPMEAEPIFLETQSKESGVRPKIGVIKDTAFQFYYPENLEALEREGGKLVLLDAIKDQRVPPIDCLYIGGGFPETNGEKLSQNHSFLGQLKEKILMGLPVYAECGGLMYLGRKIHWRGAQFPMLDLLGWDFVMEKRPVGHGYSRIKFLEDTPFFQAGRLVTGHEFHYSRPVLVDKSRAGEFKCRIERGHGFGENREGLTFKNVFATYTHIHAVSAPDWAKGLIRAAARYRSTL